MKRVVLLIFSCFLLCSSYIHGENKKLSIAVLNLQPVSVDINLAKSVSDLLRTELVNTSRFIVLERSQMKAILDELGFQESGCTDASCALKIGKMLTTDKIVIGTLTKLDRKYVINIRLVDTKKSTLDYAGKYVVDKKSDLIEGCNELAIELTEKVFNIKLKRKRERKKMKINRGWIKKGEICGSVVSTENLKAILDIGKNNGVRKGQQYEVIKYVEKEYNSYITGKREKVMEKRKIGTIKINKVETDKSSGRLKMKNTQKDIVGKEVIFIGRGKTVGFKFGSGAGGGYSGSINEQFASYETEKYMVRVLKGTAALSRVHYLDPHSSNYNKDIQYIFKYFTLMAAYKPWDFVYIGGGLSVGNMKADVDSFSTLLKDFMYENESQITASIDILGSVKFFNTTPYVYLQFGVSARFGVPYNNFEFINGEWEKNLTGFRRILLYSGAIGVGF